MNELLEKRKAASEDLIRALHKCALLTPDIASFEKFVVMLLLAVYGMAKLKVSAEEIVEAMRNEDMATMPSGEDEV